MRRALVIALSCMALAGCGGERHLDEVKQFVKESDNLPRGRIPPLPDVRPYEPFEYRADKEDPPLVDPFTPRNIVPPKAARVAGGLKPPDLDRPKGPTEQFPLDNLKMVGTLQQQKVTFALIKTPDNNLYRVKIGDFVGQNFGRITDISESELKLTEQVQDSTGEWKEEQRTLLLQE